MIEECDQVLQHNKNDVVSLCKKGRALVELGYFREANKILTIAAAAFRTVPPKGPSSKIIGEILLFLGRSLAGLGDLERAISKVRSVSRGSIPSTAEVKELAKLTTEKYELALENKTKGIPVPQLEELFPHNAERIFEAQNAHEYPEEIID